MRHPRPAPSHAPTIQRRPEPAAADLAPADDLVANPPEPTEHLRRLMATPPAPWWNGIARAWFTAGPDGGEPVRCDPQPAAPLVVSFSLDSGRHYGPSVPPAVKVSA